jgi:hypothetical protein
VTLVKRFGQKDREGVVLNVQKGTNKPIDFADSAYQPFHIQFQRRMTDNEIERKEPAIRILRRTRKSAERAKKRIAPGEFLTYSSFQ